MSQISPQGYIYGEEPYSDHPFWSDDPLVQTELTASASVDDTTGEPGVEVTRTEYVEPTKRVNFDFAFHGLKGQDGATPEVTATAQVDASSGTPSVQVTRTGPDANPNFDFSFSGLKGEQGPQGPQGETGTAVIKKITEYWNDTDKKLDLKDGDILFFNPNAGKKIYDARNDLTDDYGSYSAELSIDNESSDNPLSNAFTVKTVAGIYLNSAPLFLSGTDGSGNLTIKGICDTEIASSGMRYHFNIPIKLQMTSGNNGQIFTRLSITGTNMTCTASSDLTKIASLIICRLNIQVSLYAMMNITGLDELVYVMRIGG